MVEDTGLLNFAEIKRAQQEAAKARDTALAKAEQRAIAKMEQLSIGHHDRIDGLTAALQGTAAGLNMHGLGLNSEEILKGRRVQSPPSRDPGANPDMMAQLAAVRDQATQTLT